MTTLQYTCQVENGQIKHEEGHFFKAGAFSVTVGANRYEVTFEPKDQETVVYRLKSGDKILAELGHPDYVPECAFDALNTHLGTSDAQAIFAAFCKCGVSIEKAYLKTLESEEKNLFSYIIEQPEFL